jgi:hypothetical protein
VGRHVVLVAVVLLGVVAGGAGSVRIDGAVHTGIPGGTVYTAAGWDSATDRYLIDNTAGVSSLTLDRTGR